MDKVRIVSGRSNVPLAESISKELRIPITKTVVESFHNTEIRVEVSENIRGCHVFIVTSGNGNLPNISTNDYIFETLLFIDACKRSGATTVNVIFASYPYARSDKKDKPRVPIAGALVSRVLEAAGCKTIVSMDLHAGQIQGFTTLPFENLYAIGLHIENIKTNIFGDLSPEEINNKYVLVSLDVGGSRRVKEYAKRLGMKYALMDKQRDYTKPGTVLKSVTVGDVGGKIAICVDDMLDTCGTMVAGVNDLKSHGALSAIIAVTHGIFSGPAIERINGCDFIDSVYVVDTIDQCNNTTICPKLRVLKSGKIFAETIRCLCDRGSISELFI